MHGTMSPHGDYDHMGESINLVNNFKVEKVIFDCGEFNDLEKELIEVLNKKHIKYYSCIKELNIDSNKLYFLQTKEYDNENDNSNVIYTELNSYKFMFMGDTGIEKEKDILDKYNINDIGLVDNIFRIAQTDAKLKRDKVDNECVANVVHYDVGKKVKNTIKKLGGTMPEDSLTLEISSKELEKESKKIKNG